MTDPAGHTEWHEINLPYPPRFTRARSYENLYKIKAMLSQDQLVNGQDYMFRNDRDGRGPYIKEFRLLFRKPEHTSYYLLKWISSDWYNQK